MVSGHNASSVEQMAECMVAGASSSCCGFGADGSLHKIASRCQCPVYVCTMTASNKGSGCWVVYAIKDRKKAIIALSHFKLFAQKNLKNYCTFVVISF